MRTLLTFGDSILDCAAYNARGVHPGALLVRNDDALFPEWRGRDLASRGPARLQHRAVDGATSRGLAAQLRGLDAHASGEALALLTVGGNDLLGGLIVDDGPGFRRFERDVRAFLDALPVRPILIGNVYDPTLGDDDANFLPIDPAPGRERHARMNALLADLARSTADARLVDLHAHFLQGDPSWFAQIIEPSLVGASEVRRAVWPEVERWAKKR